MRVAIIGVRGVPVIYSGFEVLAEELGCRLADQGSQVIVYCRKRFIPDNKNYRKIARISLWSPGAKYFESLVHSLIATVHVCFSRNIDTVLYLGVGQTIFSFMPRLFGMKTVVNIDGLDWRRKKWNLIGKTYLFLSEFLSQYLCNVVLTDSDYMQRHYLKKYGKNIPNISYGYKIVKKDSGELLKKYGLSNKKYIIWVGRLVPDNNIEELIRAFKKLKGNIQCVVVGGDYYDKDYILKIKNAANDDPRFIFTDFIPHQDVILLLQDSRAYIETKRSGGTHPSLIDAIGAGCQIVITNDISIREEIKKEFITYEPNETNSLLKQLKAIMHTSQIKRSNKGINKLREFYSWNKIVDQYLELLKVD